MDRKRRNAAIRLARAAMRERESGHVPIQGSAPDSDTQFLREFVKAGGLQLDPSVWKVGQGAEQVFEDVLVQQIRRGGDRAMAAFVFEGHGSRAAVVPWGDWQIHGTLQHRRTLQLFVSLINLAHRECARANRMGW